MTQTTQPITTITFPEIALRVRDGHKLRGFFGNVFKEHSPLLHNHFQDGSPQYRYSLVQYKVLNRVPTLVGVGEAANLLVELFLKMKTLDIDGQEFQIMSKYINHQKALIGLSDDLHTYRFETLWLGLNQKNHSIYQGLEDENERKNLLKNTLVANIKTLCTDMGIILNRKEHPIMVKFNPTESVITQLKNVKMLAFGGSFTTNILIPNNLGLGKSISRGFGSIIQL